MIMESSNKFFCGLPLVRLYLDLFANLFDGTYSQVKGSAIVQRFRLRLGSSPERTKKRQGLAHFEKSSPRFN